MFESRFCWVNWTEKFDNDWTTGAYKDWDVCYDPKYGTKEDAKIESVQSIEYLARGYRDDDSNLWSLYFVDTRLKFKNYDTDSDSVVILPNFNIIDSISPDPILCPLILTTSSVLPVTNKFFFLLKKPSSNI